jgi:integrase
MANMARPADKLTDARVRSLPAPATSSRIAYDGEVKGFGLRVTAAGAKAFVLNYRINGRERRLTIGDAGSWSTTAARAKAKALKRAIDDGHDPLGEREAERTAPTMAELTAHYLEHHLPRKRASSQRDDRSMLERDVLPVLGKLKVADVRHGDVDRLHRQIGKRAPIRANRVVALLSKMFAIAVKLEWRADNPARGIERNPEERRQRFLSPAEIARLAAVLADHPERTSAALVRFLLLTGARFGEAAGARWDHLDLERGTWTKPSSHTKQRAVHRVPLSAPALALLAELPHSGPYLFPGPTGKPITTIKTMWLGVVRKAEVPGLRVHDLRHSYASILASAGMSLPIIGALLGHTQAATTQRYAHLLDDPLRAATERAGAVITGAGQEPADVVPLRKAR